MATHKLFVWNAYHNGDVLLSRPIVRHLLDRFNVDITWCCWKNHELLIRDLPIKLLVIPHADGNARDMSLFCPPDHASIDLWIGHYPDTHDIQWHNCVKVFNRQVREKGLPLEITCNLVPMFDLPQLDVSVRDRAIFVDNGAARSTQSWYEFDMPGLAAAFPTLNFYCAADPRCQLPNVFDCSRVNLLVLASISNHCMAIIGKGTGAQTCTFTETNRFKPKALMQFRMPAGVGYWDYPGSRMVRLNTHAELHAFLRQVQALPLAALAGDGSLGQQANAAAVALLAGPQLAQVSHGTAEDASRLGLTAPPPAPAPPPIPEPSAAHAPTIQVLARTSTGGQIISFGRAPAPVQVAPEDSLRFLLRAYQLKPDPGNFDLLCRERRQLARQFADLSPSQVEAQYRDGLGRQHQLLAGSRLPLLPAPVEDLPLIQALQQRLAGGFSVGAYLAGLLFRPSRFWRLALNAGDVPPWLFQAYPSQALAASQTGVSPEDQRFVAQLFADAGLDPAKTIALFAGGESPQKSCPGLGQALHPIAAAGSLHVVALGSGADTAINQHCLAESGAKSADWSGRLTWPQMVEVIRTCRLALGAEHPLAHVACALNVPNVLVLGGGSFGVSLPYSPLTSAVLFPMTCYSCSWECHFARAHCVKDISPEVIELAIREALEARGPRPRIYLRYPGLVAPPQGVKPFLNVDLLPPMLFDFIYVTVPDQPNLKLPAAVSGCSVRGVPLPMPSAPGAARPLKSMGDTSISLGK